ncbi:MAG: prolyl hydroxylase family protein [Sphingopyxis sp.]
MPFDLSLSRADHATARMAAHPRARKVPGRSIEQFLIPAFLTLDECAGLMRRIDSAVRPSTITDDIGDPLFRTSSTGDLDHGDPLVAAIDARICDLTGIDRAFGEPLQGQRYEVGQEFKAHTDYFEPGGVDFDEHTALAGQRTWTVMAYLNRVEAGGATRFTAIDKIVQPEPGKIVAWCSLTPDGAVNPATIHHALKVRKGRKYVITKWFRERPWPWA